MQPHALSRSFLPPLLAAQVQLGLCATVELPCAPRALARLRGAAAGSIALLTACARCCRLQPTSQPRHATAKHGAQHEPPPAASPHAHAALRAHATAAGPPTKPQTKNQNQKNTSMKIQIWNASATQCPRRTAASTRSSPRTAGRAGRRWSRRSTSCSPCSRQRRRPPSLRCAARAFHSSSLLSRGCGTFRTRGHALRARAFGSAGANG